jgi:hypothetical protein
MMSDDHMPEEYTPGQTGKGRTQTTRSTVAYAIGQEIKPPSMAQDQTVSMAMLHGPTPSLQQMLDIVGSENQVIVRLNTDGSDEVVYRWTVRRDMLPGRWVRGK